MACLRKRLTVLQRHKAAAPLDQTLALQLLKRPVYMNDAQAEIIGQNFLGDGKEKTVICREARQT